jgi:hypothetical protein
MAQHDYVIANGTGAAVRSDINNGLAAIVSNNSGASAPATTYAYMLWADTSTNLLKLRNGANSAWITVGDLTAANLGLAALASPTFTGTVTIPTATISTGAGIPLASAASPAIYFTGDTNTGIYSPGADQFAITTGGSGRVFVDSSGRVGLGTSSPSTQLTLNSSDTTGTGVRLENTSSGGYNWSIFSIGSAASLAPVGCLAFRDATNAATRLVIDPIGRVGIGVTSPGYLLHVEGGQIYANRNGAGTQQVLQLNNSDTTAGTQVVKLAFGSSGTTKASINAAVYGNDFLTFNTGSDTERARIDSSGRLLVGTSTSAAYGIEAKVQIAGTTDAHMSLVRHTDNAFAPTFNFVKSRGTIGSPTIVNVNDQLGTINFAGYDGTDYTSFAALIRCEVDGTPGADDMPGRLVFSTTADGASSPTERGRINSSGATKFSTSGSYRGSSTAYHEFTQGNQSDICLVTYASNASYNSEVQRMQTARAASSLFSFLLCDNNVNVSGDTEFNLRGDGNGYCDGSWAGGGADYAEYFEWSDGNPDQEDRRGISVVLDGNQIRPTVDGEEPIGVISGNPSVVGDAAWNKWSGKYLRDDYGTYIQEDYEVVNNEGETVIQQRRKLNPAYDPDQEYVNREQRPEWDCVGLMGKLRIRKGQPTGSRWIKMRDISDSVEEWLVR